MLSLSSGDSRDSAPSQLYPIQPSSTSGLWMHGDHPPVTAIRTPVYSWNSAPSVPPPLARPPGAVGLLEGGTMAPVPVEREGGGLWSSTVVPQQQGAALNPARSTRLVGLPMGSSRSLARLGAPPAMPPEAPVSRSGKSQVRSRATAATPLPVSGGILKQGSPKKARVACNQCGKDFAQKGSRDRHIRTVHQGERKFRCNICSFSFQQSYDLKSHISSVHNKERPYKCVFDPSKCTSSFPRKAKLDLHVRTVHLNVRKFVCPKCKQPFAEKSNLRKHIRHVHENIRCHQCMRCGTSFKERGHLKKHLNSVHLSNKYFAPTRMIAEEDPGTLPAS